MAKTEEDFTIEVKIGRGDDVTVIQCRSNPDNWEETAQTLKENIKDQPINWVIDDRLCYILDAISEGFKVKAKMYKGCQKR